jgi:hypothetical protein
MEKSKEKEIAEEIFKSVSCIAKRCGVYEENVFEIMHKICNENDKG